MQRTLNFAPGSGPPPKPDASRSLQYKASARPAAKPVATQVHYSTVALSGRLQQEIERIEGDTRLETHFTWLIDGRLSWGDLPSQFPNARQLMKQYNTRYVLLVSEREPDGFFQWADDHGYSVVWIPLQSHTKTKKDDLDKLVYVCKRIATWLSKCDDVSPGIEPFSVHICDTLGGLFGCIPAAAIMASVAAANCREACAFVTRAHVHRNMQRYRDHDGMMTRVPPRMLPNSPNLGLLVESLTNLMTSRSISNFLVGTIGTAKHANSRERMAGYVAEMLVLPPSMQWHTPNTQPESLIDSYIDEWIRNPRTKWFRRRQEKQAANSGDVNDDGIGDSGFTGDYYNYTTGGLSTDVVDDFVTGREVAIAAEPVHIPSVSPQPTQCVPIMAWFMPQRQQPPPVETPVQSSVHYSIFDRAATTTETNRSRRTYNYDSEDDELEQEEQYLLDFCDDEDPTVAKQLARIRKRKRQKRFGQEE